MRLGLERLVSSRQFHGDSVNFIDKESVWGLEDRPPALIAPPGRRACDQSRRPWSSYKDRGLPVHFAGRSAKPHHCQYPQRMARKRPKHRRKDRPIPQGPVRAKSGKDACRRFAFPWPLLRRICELPKGDSRRVLVLSGSPRILRLLGDHPGPVEGGRDWRREYRVCGKMHRVREGGFFFVPGRRPDRAHGLGNRVEE